MGHPPKKWTNVLGVVGFPLESHEKGAGTPQKPDWNPLALAGIPMIEETLAEAAASVPRTGGPKLGETLALQPPHRCVLGLDWFEIAGFQQAHPCEGGVCL